MTILFEKKTIHVVVAVIFNNVQDVLVSRRKSDAHMGGLLEFPGGKVEEGESVEDALCRELLEEVGIEVLAFSPLIQIPYSYQDRDVLLDVYRIEDYSRDVISKEGQDIYWKSILSLKDNDFPAANYGVLRALKFPKLYPVTPNYTADPNTFLMHFERVVAMESIQIIQLRSHELNESEYRKLALDCSHLCNKYGVKLVLNEDIEKFSELDFAGMHLTSARLLDTDERPLGKNYLVGCSCHNMQEIQHANALGLDYIILGPVIEKYSNNAIESLGWELFAKLAKESVVPVYAIGGLEMGDQKLCEMNGGQGIAAIRSIWDV